MQTLPFNPLSPEFQADPYPIYNALRESTRVATFEQPRFWLFTRYEDCEFVLRDRRFIREWRSLLSEEERASLPPLPDVIKPIIAVQRHMMLFRDPPAHTRLRGLVNKAFTPKIVQGLRDRIKQIAHYLLDQVQDQGRMDIVADFALPLPVTVIAELLGIPRADHTQFRRWSQHILGINDLVEPTPERTALTAEATVGIAGYMRELIPEKRRSPGNDLLSALIAAEEAGDMLSEDELVATAVLVLFAGFETTTNLISNGVLCFMRHPDQWQLLKGDPALLPRAVDEILRFDPPVQLTGRVVAEDMDFDGVHLERMQNVGAVFSAANRDPRVFSNPDTFDITRDEAKPLSFGAGIHYCLGAPLAKLEGEIAFDALAQRMPDLELASDELNYRQLVILRALEALPVTF